MVDLLTGPLGVALAFYLPAAGFGLLIVASLAAGTRIIGPASRRLLMQSAIVMLSGLPAWMAMFYAAMLAHGDFRDDPGWGRALATAGALFSCWLFSTAVLAVRRVSRLRSHNDFEDADGS